MELETLFGLPAHPLLVHIPVVLVPLAAIIAIVFAFRPAWLDRFGWALVGLSFVGAIGAIFAAGSGEGLETLQAEPESAAREDHFELGETARTIAILFFLIVAAIVVIRYLARKRAAKGEQATGLWAFLASKGAAILMAGALVLSGAAATYTMAKAGHQGAKLAWEEEVQPGDTGDETNEGGGDEGPADTTTVTDAVTETTAGG